MELFELLEQIRKRPGMYLSSNHSIGRLQSFLDGYYFCKASLGIPDTKQDEQWSLFKKWLYQKYSIKTSQSWAQIIQFFSNDECEALHLFFELWEEFRRKSSDSP